METEFSMLLINNTWWQSVPPKHEGKQENLIVGVDTNIVLVVLVAGMVSMKKIQTKQLYKVNVLERIRNTAQHNTNHETKSIRSDPSIDSLQ